MIPSHRDYGKFTGKVKEIFGPKGIVARYWLLVPGSGDLIEIIL
jgi:hypothetical protein